MACLQDDTELHIAYSDDYVNPSTDASHRLAVPRQHKSYTVIWTSDHADHRAHPGQTRFQTDHTTTMLDVCATGDGTSDVMQQEPCDDVDDVMAANADVVLNGHDPQATDGDVESDVMSACGDLDDFIADQQTDTEVLYSLYT